MGEPCLVVETLHCCGLDMGKKRSLSMSSSSDVATMLRLYATRLWVQKLKQFACLDPDVLDLAHAGALMRSARAKEQVKDLEGAMNAVKCAVVKLALAECLRVRREQDTPPIVLADELDRLIPWLVHRLSPST